mgnify:FL=1
MSAFPATYAQVDGSDSDTARTEDALDPTSALSGLPSTSARPWPEYDIAAEPEPYEESYLPGKWLDALTGPPQD